MKGLKKITSNTHLALKVSLNSPAENPHFDI
jgi:hypothetical protein